MLICALFLLGAPVRLAESQSVNTSAPENISSLPELVLDEPASTRAAAELAAGVSASDSLLNVEPINLGTSNNTAQQKLKPVNFTLVDEIFAATLSEAEVVKRWKFMDSQLQDGMKAILKMLFPQIVAISQDAKVSGDCSGGILKWILSLRNLRSWAVKSK